MCPVAQVVASSGGSIGFNAASQGTVTVDGTDSVLSMGPTGGCNVGYDGDGTLEITGGGLVQIQTPTVYVGPRTGGEGTVLVDGSDGSTPSTLEVTTNMFRVGGFTEANGGGVGQLTISNGGRVRSNGVLVGSGTPGGVDGTGTVTVTGNGSLLDACYHGTEAVWVGGEGNATLNVEAGGQVQANYLAMGYESGTETASMTVDGEDSSVDVTTGMNIGWARAAQLTVRNGAQLVSGTDDTNTAIIGYGITANGASVTVDAPGPCGTTRDRLRRATASWSGGWVAIRSATRRSTRPPHSGHCST